MFLFYNRAKQQKLKTIHYAEPSPGFAATPKTFNTCPQDPAWTLY